MQSIAGHRTRFCSILSTDVPPSRALRTRCSGAKRRDRHSVTVRAQGGTLTPALKSRLDEIVASNTVVCFIKGTKIFPECGFSNTVVQVLNQLNVPYETVNVLESDQLRSGLKEYSMWPTFPQVYIAGEFYGGCDILLETFQNGKLQEKLTVALNS